MPPGGPPPGQFGGAPPPTPPSRPHIALLSSPSGLRAGLLNLSGLGAGYFYLRQWPFFVAALILTGGLLITANIIGAADNLLIWVPVFVVWILAAGVHGLLNGRARDERALTRGEQPARGALSLVAAAALAVAMAVSLTGVWQTGEWQLRVADAAHTSGDCDSAVEGYERVEGAFQLSFSPPLMERARSGVEACGLLSTAQADVASGDHEQALESYGVYFDHERALWEDTDGEIADIHFDQAAALAEEGEFSEAQEVYAVIPNDYGGTEAADQVPDALVDLYDTGTSAYGQESWCDAVDQIQVFDGLEWDVAPEIPERIDTELPEAALSCGWDEIDNEHPGNAEVMVDLLTADFPDYEADDVEELERHAGAGQVEADMDEMIALDEVDMDMTPTSNDGSDTVTLLFVNDSPYEMIFLYSGPDADHGEVLTEPCEDCDVYETPPEGESCFEPGDTMEVELDPGEYRLAVGFEGQSSALHTTVELNAGDVHENCYYMVDG